MQEQSDAGRGGRSSQRAVKRKKYNEDSSASDGDADSSDEEADNTRQDIWLFSCVTGGQGDIVITCFGWHT